MKNFWLITFCAFAILQSGCGMKKMATNIIGKIATDGMVAVESEEDVDFARQTAPSLIKTLEVLKQGNPKDARSLTLLSLSYGQYAFGFLEEDMLKFKKGSPEFEAARTRADLFYRRGREYGIAALISKGSMKTAFKSSIPDFKKAVSKLGKSEVPALFWTSFNWANYLNLHLDDPNTIVDLPRIQAMIDRVIELNPKFYYSSARAFKGVIAASRPKMLGGDPAIAQKEFKQAMDEAPGYLMTKVIYARYYTKQMQDQELFKKSLNEVLEADAVKNLPEQRLANELAKRMAKLLLLKEKELF